MALHPILPSPSLCCPRRPRSIAPRIVPLAFVAPKLSGFSVRTRQLGRSLEFWRRVLAIWTSFKVTQAYVALQQRFRKPDWARRVWHAQHTRAGDKMLDLCTTLKGFYVKSGQLIALQAFAPMVIRKKLAVLQDDMPPMSEEEARRVLDDELHKLGKSRAIFESLDLRKVLGSASIAQVHRGKLVGGPDVAVKVQFPNMEALMLSDLANYRVLAEVLQRTELRFDLVGPVKELAKQVAMEFDFVAEARGMDEIRRALKKYRNVSVPEAVPGLVSRRLLVMTFLDGVPLTKLDGKLGRLRGDRAIRRVGRKVLKNLSACYGKMILSDGFFQADCHPGNILVRNANIDIGLLDFGQTKRFSQEQRVSFARLVDAMSRHDTQGIRRGLEGLGIVVKRRGGKGARRGSGTGLGRRRSQLTAEEELAYTMFDTAARAGVSDNPFSADSVLRVATVSELPHDLVFLLRTMQLLRGICRATFNNDFSMVAGWGAIARAQIRGVAAGVPAGGA